MDSVDPNTNLIMTFYLTRKMVITPLKSKMVIFIRSNLIVYFTGIYFGWQTLNHPTIMLDGDAQSFSVGFYIQANEFWLGTFFSCYRWVALWRHHLNALMYLSCSYADTKKRMQAYQLAVEVMWYNDCVPHMYVMDRWHLQMNMRDFKMSVFEQMNWLSTSDLFFTEGPYVPKYVSSDVITCAKCGEHIEEHHYVLHCSHTFHKDCVDTWTMRSCEPNCSTCSNMSTFL